MTGLAAVGLAPGTLRTEIAAEPPRVPDRAATAAAAGRQVASLLEFEGFAVSREAGAVVPPAYVRLAYVGDRLTLIGGTPGAPIAVPPTPLQPFAEGAGAPPLPLRSPEIPRLFVDASF